MSDMLPGFEASGGDQVADIAQEAARAIYRVRDALGADLDKMIQTINRGGGLPEMRAAVDAAWLTKEIITGLDKAAALVLGKAAAVREGE